MSIASPKTSILNNSVGRLILDYRFIFLIIALIYIGVYFAIPATPGNAPYDHPLGWWGWFDQGKYLLSANALAHFDFTPDKHFYPPLYPAIGAIFLKWSSGHMYFAFDLLALLWFSFVFIRFSDRYVPRWGSVALLFGAAILNQSVIENFAIPWTTTLSVALISSGILGLVWLQEVRVGSRTRVTGLQVFFVATCLGLIVPTRPADSVVGGVLALSLLIGYWSNKRLAIQGVPRIGQFILLTIAGSIIGPMLFLIFNFAVFHSLIGGYIQTNAAHGFFFADLAEKFVSIWLDGFTLYGEHNAGLVQHYPWLLLSLAGLVWVLIRGDSPLRSVAYAIIALFVTYLPYGDLLPNGLWRYLNIHYFKWTFPFFALFAVLLVKQVIIAWRKKEKRILPTVLLTGIPLLLLSLHIVVDVTPVTILAKENSSEIRLDLPNKQVDLVDIKGLTGGFTDVYFGNYRAVVDGRELQNIRDYRVLPMSSGVRVLFARPVIGHSLEFYPDPKLSRLNGHLSAYIGTYHFALGALKPFRQLTQQDEISDYRLGELVKFSNNGYGWLYATDGWSGPEKWGRWSVNDGASIQLRVADHTQPLELELVFGAFVSKAHPCQQVGILINNRNVAQQSLCVGNGGENPAPYKFKLDQNLLRPDGSIDIRIVTPDSISPKVLGMSTDNRKLGIGIISMRLTASE